MQSMLPGLEPTSEDDWLTLRIEVSQLFSPTYPIKEFELFAGRREQISRVIDAIFQAGQHIIIYGDRGVGKTSLINSLRQRIFAQSNRVKFFNAQCFDGDDFATVWERAFNGHRWLDGTDANDEIHSNLNPHILLSVIEKFSPNISPVFIFDEFDRIKDEETKLRMAETIKLLSDRAIETTVLVAGIGRTVTDLITSHASISRAMRQIQMPRMSTDEIRDIINVRLKRVRIEIDPDALRYIVFFAHGMPGYAHLLGLYSAYSAIEKRSLKIDWSALFQSLETCLQEVGESTRHAYTRATRSVQPNNSLKQTLLACALAPPDDEIGSFTAASLREPIRRIMKQDSRDIPDYSRHLTAFLREERGPILEREGTPKNYHYRFIDPMMQSYVIMRGAKEGRLPTVTIQS